MPSEPETLELDALLAAITERRATIGVIGLGYVGLPLAGALLAAGFRVLGFDIDPEKERKLRAGEAYISHLPVEPLHAAIDDGRFDPLSDLSRAGEADALLICVPTPLTRQREPDLGAVRATLEGIAPHLRRGQLVVLESTTYPGTTRELVVPLLSAGGLACGRDFFVAFSPEREDPGNPNFTTTAIPKVVGADDDASRRLAIALYEQVISRVVAVSSLATAEAVKITENIFRSVNIALVNELKCIFTAMDIDVWEVIEAAKTKPFGYMPFYPGPGLGGHCIPIDPFYLTWKAREYGIATRFIELAGEINTAMPDYVVGRLTAELSLRQRRSVNGARILILGIAYKKNIDDVRESPAFVLIEKLERQGAIVDFHDPHAAIVPPTREHAALAGRRSVPLTEEGVRGYDAVLICTDHDGVDYGMVAGAAALVIDTRNALERSGAGRPPTLVKA